MLSEVSRRTGSPASLAEERPGAREEQFQMVVQLRHRADGGARSPYRIRLVDRDRGRNRRAMPPSPAACPFDRGTGARRARTFRRYRRWPSAYSVSNTSDDFPDPETPVTTTSSFRGMSRFEIFQVVLARTADRDCRGCSLVRSVTRVVFHSQVPSRSAVVAVLGSTGPRSTDNSIRRAATGACIE